jgi:hypothetical protein
MNSSQIFPNAVQELNDRLTNPVRYTNNPIWKNNGYGNRAEKIFKAIYEGEYNLMASACIIAEKVIMPLELYHEAISTFEFLRWGAVRFENTGNEFKTYPKIFGLDVEIGDTFAVKSGPQFNKTVDLTSVWKRMCFGLNGLVIVVKSRIRTEYKVKSAAESKALDSLREMISEAEFRKYLTYGFFIVKGKSGKLYQIFYMERHIQVWDKGRHVEDLCVYLKDDKIPPTDKLIAFKVMIESDEESFRNCANIYKL